MIFSLFKPRSLFKSKPTPPPERVARLPEGVCLYAIGDVHGRADLLEAMARLIETDVKGKTAYAKTIFLGDYIDRGPASAEVLRRLSRGEFPTPILGLRGNHEATLLRFLEDEIVLEEWRGYGGIETLASYGVDVSQVRRGAGFREARLSLVERLPGAQLDFLTQLKISHEVGDYFFCHAGVRPGVPLFRQTEADLLWIRGAFLNSRVDFGKRVVHGHTPVAAAEFHPNRVNIDTGAYITGVLTCLALEGESAKILST